ncbi:MAG: GNAT family N-acetyltransferase [Fimbriimonadales bacterium]
MGLTIRTGAADDAENLARHRCEMFREMGTLSDEGYAELMPASVAYFREAIPEGRYLAWLACDEDEVVAGGGMQVSQMPPRPGPAGRMLAPGPQGLILNMFVEPNWRRRGVATLLMAHMIEYARANGFPSLTLHASEAGRRLYEGMGFTPTSEMRLYL